MGVFKNISISTFLNYYEAVMQTCEIPAMLVLHEDEISVIVEFFELSCCNWRADNKI